MAEELVVSALILFGLAVAAFIVSCVVSILMIRRSMRDYSDAADAHGRAEECYVKAAEILRAAQRGDFRVVDEMMLRADKGD